MITIIDIGETLRVVKEKITFYGIPKDDPCNIRIWLEGGGVVNNTHDSEAKALESLKALDKIMKSNNNNQQTE